jgi:anti-sigma regulatory factor (Ser/Thr protein kinase)
MVSPCTHWRWCFLRDQAGKLADGVGGDLVNRSVAILTIRNALEELERAAVWLDGFAEATGIAADATSKLQVAMDEVLSNIINHGFSGAARGQHEIGLDVRRLQDRVELEISDDGPEFDPTRAEPQAPRDDSSELRVGGAGLNFVRSLVDDLRYQRNAGLNCLLLTKRLPAAAARDQGRDGDS